MASAVLEIIWMRAQLKEIGNEIIGPVIVLSDSKLLSKLQLI